MGYERDYEYGPLPTEPNGQPPVVPQRKRCRGGVIARLALVAGAAWATTWAARQYMVHYNNYVHHSEGHGGMPCSSMPQVVSPAEVRLDVRTFSEPITHNMSLSLSAENPRGRGWLRQRQTH